MKVGSTDVSLKDFGTTAPPHFCGPRQAIKEKQEEEYEAEVVSFA